VWVGYPNATTSMNDVNGLGPGFGGTLAAPIWHDYMQQATNGYCGDFPPPTTRFHGTPFFGHYAVTGNSGVGVPGGNRNGNGNGTGNGTGTGTGTGTNQYTNPTLYQQPPQPPTRTGTGNGTGAGNPPPGFGNGHLPGSGGAGVGHRRH
jgi:membrane peptidoglycan carboxypeptidase